MMNGSKIASPCQVNKQIRNVNSELEVLFRCNVLYKNLTSYDVNSLYRYYGPTNEVWFSMDEKRNKKDAVHLM